jgi:hypothetical protein
MPKFFSLAEVLLSQADRATDSAADTVTQQAREMAVLIMVMSLYQDSAVVLFV